MGGRVAAKCEKVAKIDKKTAKKTWKIAKTFVSL